MSRSGFNCVSGLGDKQKFCAGTSEKASPQLADHYTSPLKSGMEEWSCRIGKACEIESSIGGNTEEGEYILKPQTSCHYQNELHLLLKARNTSHSQMCQSHKKDLH